MPERVIFITGTSTGIGRATVFELLGRGHRVVAAMRNPEDGDSLLAEAGDAAARLSVVGLDVTDPSACERCINDVLSSVGEIDVLINNAGRGRVGSLEQLLPGELEETMQVNFFSVANLTKAVLPQMRERRQGKILTVTSVGGIVGQPFNDAYCAAKFAVEGLMECLAPVAETFGVSVSVLEPGPVSTSFISNVMGDIARIIGDDGDPYRSMFDGYVARAGDTFAGAQTSEEVAAVIADAVESETPVFRMQTSPGARAFVSPKLNDLDGSAILTMTKGWIK